MTQVGDLDDVLKRIGTWKVGGYIALSNADIVAHAVATGYVTEREGRYELTETGAARLCGETK